MQTLLQIKLHCTSLLVAKCQLVPINKQLSFFSPLHVCVFDSVNLQSFLWVNAEHILVSC